MTSTPRTRRPRRARNWVHPRDSSPRRARGVGAQVVNSRATSWLVLFSRPGSPWSMLKPFGSCLKPQIQWSIPVKVQHGFNTPIPLCFIQHQKRCHQHILRSRAVEIRHFRPRKNRVLSRVGKNKQVISILIHIYILLICCGILGHKDKACVARKYQPNFGVK